MKNNTRPLSVYIHIPFCRKRCRYCDFFSGTDLENIDTYIDRLCAEIKAFDFADYFVETIYIGGGTPGLLSPVQIKRIFNVLPPCVKEVSIECNPNSLTEEKLSAYKNCGVNRISIGIQSFDNATLKLLGRSHTAEEAIAAVKLAKKYFDNISIDLIKNIAGGRVGDIPVRNSVTHISVYSLMPYGGIEAADEDSDEMIKLPGFIRYEISNYAKAGYECEHNKAYWHGKEYIGFGAGAHSFINNTRFNNSENVLGYIRENIHIRTNDEIRTERIMLGLRMVQGIDSALVQGKDLSYLRGFIGIKNGRIIATKKGWEVLNQIILRLIT
jgi:oxygen-independent coproporphyrinogen-3 oxidase